MLDYHVFFERWLDLVSLTKWIYLGDKEEEKEEGKEEEKERRKQKTENRKKEKTKKYIQLKL